MRGASVAGDVPCLRRRLSSCALHFSARRDHPTQGHDGRLRASQPRPSPQRGVSTAEGDLRWAHNVSPRSLPGGEG